MTFRRASLYLNTLVIANTYHSNTLQNDAELKPSNTYMNYTQINNAHKNDT
jgi:hypothetical protein